jgi:hypothetical protein
VGALAVPLAASLALAVVGGVSSCVASQAPNLPPPIGSESPDGGFGDLSTGPVITGPCPGQGTVTVSFDRGTATQTCWSSYSPLVNPGGFARAGQPTVSVSGNPQSSPGLSVAIALFVGDFHGTACAVGPGSKLALDGPCVSVTVAYGEAAGNAEWQASGGVASQGSLIVGSYGTTPGSPISVSFSPGASLVLDAPSHPLVSISGSASAPLQ